MPSLLFLFFSKTLFSLKAYFDIVLKSFLSSDWSILVNPLLYWLTPPMCNIPEILFQIVILMPAVCSICFHTFKHKYGLQSEEDGLQEKVNLKSFITSYFKLSDFDV